MAYLVVIIALMAKIFLNLVKQRDLCVSVLCSDKKDAAMDNNEDVRHVCKPELFKCLSQNGYG